MNQLPYNTLKEGIIEWYTWYRHHRDTERSVEMKIDFMQTTIDGLVDLLAVAAVEIETLKALATTPVIEGDRKIIVPVLRGKVSA